MLACLTSQQHASVMHLSIYLVLFVLQVAHKASTRARHRCRSAETRSRRPHVQPFSFISLSTVLLQVSLGRPLFLWPSGVHRRAILVKAVVCWRSTCPIHRHCDAYIQIIMKIIIIASKGVIRDFLQSPHCTNTYALVTLAQSYANHVQHIERSSRATCCFTRHVVRRDSSASEFDRVAIAFI